MHCYYNWTTKGEFSITGSTDEKNNNLQAHRNKRKFEKHKHNLRIQKDQQVQFHKQNRRCVTWIEVENTWILLTTLGSRKVYHNQSMKYKWYLT